MRKMVMLSLVSWVRTSTLQRRAWEHAIHEAEYAQHLDYVHLNPVKHLHVAEASEWP